MNTITDIIAHTTTIQKARTAWGRAVNLTRASLHLSQRDTASRCGITQQAVARWESGHSVPDIADWAGIDAALGGALLPILSDLSR